ncbi:MAG: cell division protein ZapA [Alteromonadaceae bacterium]|nr:cell division protein ZapA [Alteromonadaceae bacterium]
MSHQTIEIKVIDRKLKISCPTGQETALVASATELNSRLEKASSGKTISTPEQALLLTALNLANDLLKAQQELHKERQENKNKIELLQSTIEHALNNQKNKQA